MSDNSTSQAADSSGHPPFRVLFLCSGNAARSIMAEAILNRLGAGRFVAYSAGSRPRGSVDPHAQQLLETLGFETAGLRSKSWDEFAGPDAPDFDFIFTLCDEAAGEACPVWPGHPTSAHWGIEDPAAVKGNDAEVAVAYDEALRMIRHRIEAFVALPISGLDKQSLHHRLHEIGKLEGASSKARA